jgi:hypothetical protein
MKISLIDDFPRSMGNPKQTVVYTKEQRDEYIKQYIKKTDLYISVYKFTQIKEDGKHAVSSSAVVDKVFFDFDTDNWLNDLIILHKWCLKRNILHRCHCSGRGGHVFIFIKRGLQNKKKALANFQRGICEELGLTIDNRIVGDIARIFRYPNTVNRKARYEDENGDIKLRFCVPLSRLLMYRHDTKYEELTEEIVFEYAQKQRFENPWMGSKLLDISEYDVDHYQFKNYDIEIDFEEINIDVVNNIDFTKFPPCIQSWFSTKIVTDYVKHLETVFLKDQQEYIITPEDSVSIFKVLWHPGEFNHYFYGGKGELPRRHKGHYGRKHKRTWENDYDIPGCRELKEKGLCTSETCPRVHPIYEFGE